jgi:hypothetical protein
MTESQIRALFAEEADGEPAPSQVDQIARRRGRARLRWRRAGMAGASALAAAAVATLVVGVVGVNPARPGSDPAAAGRAAPRQFDPLITNVSFGFLPAGESIQQGGVVPTEAFVTAAASPSDLGGWAVYAYAQGRCHLTVHASNLSCPGPALTGATVRLSGPAPAVGGHHAFWARSGLVWQYARGGWALLDAPVPSKTTLRHDPHLRPLAIRIARHLRIGAATPHLVFPAQFSGLNSQWRVGETHYLAEAGALQAQDYTLLSAISRFLPHVGDTGIWTNGVYVLGERAPGNGTCSPHDPSTRNHSEIINGFRVVVKHGAIGGETEQELCSAHADGLWFDIQEFGSHPPIGVATLFRHHVQLLGPNSAKWIENPIS